MSNSVLTAEQKQLATSALAHQNAGHYAEAAQTYVALLSMVPQLWPACYNLGLVYQYLQRLPEAAEMYARTVRLNPQFAEAYNNLGNVLKTLKNDATAIEAYQQAIAINPQLSEAAYNLGTMLRVRGQHQDAIDSLRQALAVNPVHSDAWDALYHSLIATGRQEDAIQAFLDWERSTQLSPELVVAGLALCRPLGDREREEKYLGLAVEWPFAAFTPDQYAPLVGMIQYFDVTRSTVLECYRRFDRAVAAQKPAVVALLPRRTAGTRLRIGYVSGDFRQHVMGRMMLDVISRHDADRFSVLLISTCTSTQHDAVTAEFRRNADGFADISELDDFAAAKIIAEADIDVLVDLGGQTNSARPGIYAHKPARSIVTHLGSHGCIGLSAVDYKLTDAIADLPDAGEYQIEQPYVLDTCLFPFVRTLAPQTGPGWVSDTDLAGKFVFAAFLNILKLSPRCLKLWARVLEALPEALLLFSPLDPAENAAIRRLTSNAGIEPARIAILDGTRAVRNDSALRARYRLVHAVMDTMPYAGGDTTLAALDMGVPVVTLSGQRQSERIGTSILSHLGVTELVADSEDQFVATAIRLARDATFMAGCREKISLGYDQAVAGAGDYTRALEKAYTDISARKPVPQTMEMSSRQFFQTLHDAMRRQEKAGDDGEKRAIANVFADLRGQQPDYPPLLRAQGQLAQDMKDLPLASDCLAALLKQNPDDLDARLTLAGFLIDQGNAADALQILEDSSSAGVNARLLKLQTRAHGQLRQWDIARQYSERAVAMEPADIQALFWHGTVLSHAGEIDAALSLLNRALILSPSHAEAAYNAGVLLGELGNHADAEKVFRRAMAADSTPPSHLRLLQTLKLQQRHADWQAEARRFVDAHPTLDYTRLLQSRLARQQGNLQREAEILLPLAEQATQMADDATAFELLSELLTILPCHDVSPRLLEQLRERFIRASRSLFPDNHPAEEAQTAASLPSKIIKLGYLADFSQPFLRDVIRSLATLHDQSRFSVTIFTISPTSTSLPAELVAAGANHVALAALDESRCAGLIRASGIDVLIDAAGFANYAKPGLLSMRPAAVQIAMPGLSVTGMGDVDHQLTDHQLQLVDDTGEAAIAPLFVDGCALPVIATYPEAESMPPISSPTRAALGIHEYAIVFGVFASAEQLSPRCVALWRSLLQRIPDAVLLLDPLDAGDVTTQRKILAASGIEGARIFSASRDTRMPAISIGSLADIILDTMPASDYASVRLAIVGGIPIVTMAGRTAGERVALSLLHHLGETSTVADSGRDYVDIAVHLAGDAVKRKALSAKLKSLWQSASQPGMSLSAQAFVRRVEAAIIGARTPPGSGE